MTEPSVTHSKFTVERRFAKPAASVFAAFADPAKKRRWFAESENHDIQEFVSDFRVGGVERLRYVFTGDAPIHGMVLTSEGRHENIVPDRGVVISSRMATGDHVFSCSLVTMELLPDDDGTRLLCTFQGAFFEHSDGPEMRRMGWETLLDRISETIG
jgi:uncharacterized protein YndB with AHSA1/START domain